VQEVGDYQTPDRMRFTVSNLVYDASEKRFAALATFPDLVSTPPNPAQVQARLGGSRNDRAERIYEFHNSGRLRIGDV
jgi:hypothetical protein